jgi:hypothetical protein
MAYTNKIKSNFNILKNMYSNNDVCRNGEQQEKIRIIIIYWCFNSYRTTKDNQQKKKKTKNGRRTKKKRL